jgi:hypothetical protein
MRYRTMAAGMAVAVAAIAGTAPAVHAEQEIVIAALDTPDDERLDRARVLREQAEALFSEPRQWRRAARLLERSADLRTDTDPEAYTCLLTAGRIRAAIGDDAGAQQALQRAGAHAAARGAVHDAATAWVDAAFAAAKHGNADAAKNLFARAELLLESPALNETQRDALRQRLPIRG